MPSPIRASQRNAQQEFRSASCIRFYFDAAVMQLEDAVGHRQADAAASGFCSEVEVENLLANLVGNAGALIGDAQDGVPAVCFQPDLQLAAFGHGLRAV